MFPIEILDDDIFEYDEFFWIHCESLNANVDIDQSEIKITIAGPNDG